MPEYNFTSFNRTNPFELKLTGAETESLMNLLDKEWAEKQNLPGELQSVRADLHSFFSTFHRQEEKA